MKIVEGARDTKKTIACLFGDEEEEEERTRRFIHTHWCERESPRHGSFVEERTFRDVQNNYTGT